MKPTLSINADAPIGATAAVQNARVLGEKSEEEPNLLASIVALVS
jgi:hypothetical protein